MYVTQYALLFGAGVLLSIGAYVGYARGLASIMSFFVWQVLGNASSALQVFPDGSSEAVVVGSQAVAYLCYANGFISVVLLLFAFYEWYVEEEEETIQRIPRDIERRLS